MIIQIMHEKRAAGLRWFKVDRAADFVPRHRATPAQISDWEAYQRAHSNAAEDREAEYAAAPFETPSILQEWRGEDGEVEGYVRSYAPGWEPEEHVHAELVRAWEGTEVYARLKAEEGW